MDPVVDTAIKELLKLKAIQEVQRETPVFISIVELGKEYGKRIHSVDTSDNSTSDILIDVDGQTHYNMFEIVSRRFLSDTTQKGRTFTKFGFLSFGPETENS